MSSQLLEQNFSSLQLESEFPIKFNSTQLKIESLEKPQVDFAVIKAQNRTQISLTNIGRIGSIFNVSSNSKDNSAKAKLVLNIEQVLGNQEREDLTQLTRALAGKFFEKEQNQNSLLVTLGFKESLKVESIFEIVRKIDV